MTDTPNPGSDAAQAQGCTCPVLDNSHGLGYLLNPDSFVIREGCPLHGLDLEIGPEPEEDDHNPLWMLV